MSYLLLSSLQDGINVFIGNLTLLRGEHMSGTMSNDGQHLVFAKLARVWIDQPAWWEATVLIMFIIKINHIDQNSRINLKNID